MLTTKAFDLAKYKMTVHPIVVSHSRSTVPELFCIPERTDTDPETRLGLAWWVCSQCLGLGPHTILSLGVFRLKVFLLPSGGDFRLPFPHPTEAADILGPWPGLTSPISHVFLLDWPKWDSVRTFHCLDLVWPTLACSPQALAFFFSPTEVIHIHYKNLENVDKRKESNFPWYRHCYFNIYSYQFFCLSVSAFCHFT